jgi:Ca-activated chloride channel family protein
MNYLMKLPRTLRCVGAVLLLLFSWVGVKAQSLDGQSLNARSVAGAAVFRTSSQVVLVPVTVTDRYGKSIEGLRAKDFTIQEDRVSQQIVSFGAEDAPCSVGLVLDVSGSMRNTLSGAKGVAQSFFQASNPGDEFLLLTVSTRPDSGEGFTTDVGDLERSIDRTTPGGMTALIDTVYLGLSRMRKANRPRRALLILSDGIDNHSRYSKSELLRIALEADVQIYTIIFDNGAADASTGTIPYRPALIRKPGDRAQEPEGPRMLEELSDKTGGLHFHVHSDAEAKAAASKAGQALRNQYVIGYQPPMSGATGQWHRIHVKSNVPKVNVYARNGYYAP